MFKQTSKRRATSVVGKGLVMALVGAGAWLAESSASAQFQAQFQPPMNATLMDSTGKLEGMQGNLLKFRDADDAVWLVQVSPQTAVTIVGEADLSYLRTGMLVEFTGKINEEGELEEPISTLEVLNTKGRPTMGLFEVGDDSPDAKPLRDPTVGEYRVRARLIGVKEDQLNLAAGRMKLTGKAAEDLKVTLEVDDARLAQAGDEMKLKAWYYDATRPNPAQMQPGKAIAESVDITLANPPQPGRRGR